MSHEDHKLQHSQRLHYKQIKAQRQYDLASRSFFGPPACTPHRFHKKHAFNCGNPHCVMCMNPRKAFGEKTVQEQRFEQRRLHEQLLDIDDEV
jgi:hypothetical protein